MALLTLKPKMEAIWDDGKPSSPKFLSVLLLGPAKIGKSTAAIGTTPGPVYVIDSDGRDSTVPVRRHHANAKFAKNFVDSIQSMENALVTARALVKEDKVKTIVWDTLSSFSEYLEAECFEKTRTNEGNLDGRKAYPKYTKMILEYASRLMKIDAHIVVTCHHFDIPTEDETKRGPGIVAGLATKEARAKIGKNFSDILFMDKDLKKERVIRTGIDGVWGPGSRNVDGNQTIPPDFREFMKIAGFAGHERKIGQKVSK